MKKNILIVFVTFIVLLTACSQEVRKISTPSWLHGSWVLSGNGDIAELYVTEDNLQYYLNGYLELDIKSNLEINNHVEIKNQASTNNSYQIDLYNTQNQSIARINILYTERNNTITYKEIFNGIVITNIVLSR